MSASVSSALLFVPPVPDNSERYMEVIDSCDFEYKGECVNVRSGPGIDYPIVTRLRTGIVLSITDTVTENGRSWYKIGFGQKPLYPERVTEDWYVATDLVHEFRNEGERVIKKGETAVTTKRIVIDISEQKLFAYHGDTLFMEEPISTGLEDTPTPRGAFSVFKMTPTRFMQGPIPEVSEQVYDLPGVPWDIYFTHGGAAIHGAYWHDSFGERWSHGCVNLDLQTAKRLYMWAEIGMNVVVQN